MTFTEIGAVIGTPAGASCRRRQMADATLKPIGAAFCEIVRYDHGYSGRDDLPIVNGQPQFAAGIPDS
jgi:hypothetical protein